VQPGQHPPPDPACEPPVAHESRVRVYYEDTDAGGIVYHANWLRYFERARTDWLRALGVVHRELAAADGVQLVVRDLSIDYRRPARLDDELRIDVRLLEARPARLLLRQCARMLATDDILVQAELTVAAVGVQRLRPAGMPRWLLQRLRAPSSRLPAQAPGSGPAARPPVLITRPEHP
jgi:acyl-CoA thioester hydrolase